jgi:hypothetical protein
MTGRALVLRSHPRMTGHVTLIDGSAGEARYI